MIKVNLAVPVLNLKGEPLKDMQGERDKDGNPIEDLMINQILGNMIANKQKSKDPIYERNLAIKIYSTKGEIELNTKDIAIIDKTIKEGGLSALVDGQIREILEMPAIED